MRILSFVIILLTSSSLMGQVDRLENLAIISKEEAITIAKHKGYFLRHAELVSNQWIIVYAKGVGYTNECKSIGGGCYVYKNITTRIDAATGEIQKKSKFNTAMGGNQNGQPILNVYKRRKKMKVGNEKITVYY